jgi:hypothetical protein
MTSFEPHSIVVRRHRSSHFTDEATEAKHIDIRDGGKRI